MKTPDHANFWRSYFTQTKSQQRWGQWLSTEDKLAMLEELMQWDDRMSEETETADVVCE